MPSKKHEEFNERREEMKERPQMDMNSPEFLRAVNEEIQKAVDSNTTAEQKQVAAKDIAKWLLDHCKEAEIINEVSRDRIYDMLMLIKTRLDLEGNRFVDMIVENLVG